MVRPNIGFWRQLIHYEQVVSSSSLWKKTSPKSKINQQLVDSQENGRFR
jgi:hypothetical protein